MKVSRAFEIFAEELFKFRGLTDHKGMIRLDQVMSAASNTVDRVTEEEENSQDTASDDHK